MKIFLINTNSSESTQIIQCTSPVKSLIYYLAKIMGSEKPCAKAAQVCITHCFSKSPYHDRLRIFFRMTIGDIHKIISADVGSINVIAHILNYFVVENIDVPPVALLSRSKTSNMQP